MMSVGVRKQGVEDRRDGKGRVAVATTKGKSLKKKQLAWLATVREF